MSRLPINQNIATHNFLIRSHPYFASRLIRPFITWLASDEGIAAREKAAEELLEELGEDDSAPARLESITSPEFVVVACKAIFRAATLTMRQVAASNGLIHNNTITQAPEGEGKNFEDKDLTDLEDILESISNTYTLKFDTLTLPELGETLDNYGLYPSYGLRKYGYGHLSSEVWGDSLVFGDPSANIEEIERTDEQFMAEWLVLSAISLAQEMFVQKLLDSISTLPLQEDDSGEEQSDRSDIERETVLQVRLLESLFAHDYYDRYRSLFYKDWEKEQNGSNEKGVFKDPLVSELEGLLSETSTNQDETESDSEEPEEVGNRHLQIYGLEPMSSFEKLSSQHIQRKLKATLASTNETGSRPLAIDPCDLATTCALISHAFVCFVYEARRTVKLISTKGSEESENAETEIKKSIDTCCHMLQTIHVALQILQEDVSPVVLSSIPSDIPNRILPALISTTTSVGEREFWKGLNQIDDLKTSDEDSEANDQFDIVSTDEQGRPTVSLAGALGAVTASVDEKYEIDSIISKRIEAYRKLAADVASTSTSFKKRLVSINN